MADLNGVNIQKGKIGANTVDNNDTVSGIVIASPVTGGLSYDTPVAVYNLTDVEGYGITADFDTTNNINVYRHLYEFYRMAGEGVELHLMLVDNATTMSDICENKASKLLAFAKGKVRQIAIAVNPTTVPTLLNGIPQEVFEAIPKAQGLYDWAFNNNMPLQVFLEGFNYSGEASSSQNLREIENVAATKVSVFIGQDYNYAASLSGQKQKYADVGTLLGCASVAFVNQNVGNNQADKFNLTDATIDAWMEPGLSSHQMNDEVFEDLQTLEDKGYCFGIEYDGLAGVRINNDHTCTPIIKDSDFSTNEHTIALGRVNDKAIRSLRTAYLPYVKTDWPVDPSTGKMPPAVVTAMEAVGDNVFQDMTARGEISYGKTTIDADSDLLISKDLGIGFKIVPKGNINEINGTINLKTQV